jgi:hypothetical protein
MQCDLEDINKRYKTKAAMTHLIACCNILACASLAGTLRMLDQLLY